MTTGASDARMEFTYHLVNIKLEYVGMYMAGFQ